MRVIVAIILLIIILTMGISEQIVLKRVFSELNSRTNEISEALENEEYEKALQLTEETDEFWQNKLELLEFYVSHNSLIEIGINLSLLHGLIEGEDYAQSAASCQSLIGLSEALPKLLGFRIEHIF